MAVGAQRADHVTAAVQIQHHAAWCRRRGPQPLRGRRGRGHTLDLALGRRGERLLRALVPGTALGDGLRVILLVRPAPTREAPYLGNRRYDPIEYAGLTLWKHNSGRIVVETNGQDIADFETLYVYAKQQQADVKTPAPSKKK
jgi:hypothetical protein